MFHVILALPVLLILAAIASIVLFGIAAIVAACVGGVSVAVLIKKPLTKKLLFLGFGVLLFLGLLCLIPVIAAYVSLPAIVSLIAANLIYLCVALLAVVGIRLSCTIGNRIGRTILIIAFCIVLTAVLSLAIFTGIASCYMMS